MASFRKVAFFSFLLAGLAPAAAHAGDAAKGAAVFKRCAVCHSVEAGKKSSVGPNLAGVIGRKAGTTPFSYSPAMKNAGFAWTAEKLDQFLQKPSAVVKGSRMAFGGLPNGQDRSDLIAYLETRK
ncbi:MAG TPA: cytochrome c family protein [Rhizorhapis sp.]|nr:cytochrome c family protein [Rhizorhapis sp.]HKR17119.1 cytochrome c family protein [Rhizorhapis sp.]